MKKKSLTCHHRWPHNSHLHRSTRVVKVENERWALTTNSPHAGELEEASDPLGGSAGGVATFGRRRRDGAVLATLLALLALTSHYLATVPHELGTVLALSDRMGHHTRCNPRVGRCDATRTNVDGRTGQINTHVFEAHRSDRLAHYECDWAERRRRRTPRLPLLAQLAPRAAPSQLRTPLISRAGEGKLLLKSWPSVFCRGARPVHVADWVECSV